MGGDFSIGNLMTMIVAVAAPVAAYLYWLSTRRRIAAETVGRAEEQAARALRDAGRDAEAQKKEILLEAKEKAHAIVSEAEREASRRQQQADARARALADEQRALADRLAAAERQAASLATRAQSLDERERSIAEAQTRAEALVTERSRELQQVAGLTADEAKELLLRQMESDARREAATLIKRLEAEARETAAAKAKHVVTDAIQRSAAEHAIETTVSVVDLPNDEMKGRIIGREGRNIRALEVATGVELIVDDTPGAIILSSFDPYRREIARQAIERLVADGRIHPARIEEIVDKVKAEIEESVLKDGEAAAFELGLYDLHPDILRLMGKLKFRTSYGQNVLNHSKEVAFVAGIMAREVGLDAPVTTRAAFLHDIGKAIDRDLQGTHLELGVEFLRKHGEGDAVIGAVAAHHMDIDWPSLEAMIVQAESLERDVMPAYTHLQRAQPVSGAHWMLSHFWPVARDRRRLAAAADACATLPLGSGAIAGSDATFDAFCRRHGIARVSMFESLVDVPALLVDRPLPRPTKRGGKRVAVATTTGGGAAMVVDNMAMAGLDIASPPKGLVDWLKPLGIAAGEVFVHGHEVNAFLGQGVEIKG